jgi:hypothetical protein
MNALKTKHISVNDCLPFSVTQIFQQVVWQLFALLLGFFIGGTLVVSFYI